MAESSLTDPNAVPVEVIRPYIRRWLELYRVDHVEVGSNAHSTSYIKSSDNEGHLGVLSFHSGVSGRVLRQYLNTENVQKIPFDLADKIVIATAGPMAWHTDEALTPYYGPFEVRPRELQEGRELPAGFDIKSLPRAKQLLWLTARQRMEEAA